MVKSLFESLFVFVQCTVFLYEVREINLTATVLDNKDNHAELVQFQAKIDKVLHAHLEKAHLNAMYTPKAIQNKNELHDCVNIPAGILKITSKQVHRTNVPEDSSEVHYHRILHC